MMDDTIRYLMVIERIPIPKEEEDRLRACGKKMIGALPIKQAPRGPAKANEFIVGQLVGQGAQVLGFAREVKKLLTVDEPCGEEEDCDCGGIVADQLKGFPFKPDAFTITEDEVCIYEVEVTSRLTENKLRAYADVWWILDEQSIFFRLFVVDVRGSMKEIDLPGLFDDEPVLEAVPEDDDE